LSTANDATLKPTYARRNRAGVIGKAERVRIKLKQLYPQTHE